MLERSPLKWKLAKIFSPQVKIYQIPYVNFGTKPIPLQIVHPSSVSWKITPLYFFSLKNIYFAQKKPIKVKISETLECSGQNLSKSLWQFWNEVDSSPNFASLFCFMKDNWYVHFYLEQYILCSKETQENETIWNFQVLRSKFVKLLMSILKRQMFPLQILYRS